VLAIMSQDNQITLRGYLTAEPKFKETATRIPLTEIRVGSTPRRLNRETGEWQDGQASYYNVTCWRRLAINAASSLHKGDMVVVRGRFHTNTWLDNQQQTRTSLEIEADSIGHDLAYGWSHFLRGVRQQPGGTAGGDAGELARQDTGLPGNADDDEYPGDSEWGEPSGALGGAAGQADPGDPAEVSHAIGGDGDLEDPGAGRPVSEILLPEPEAVPF
jgi:single-strand DNA-binding protein